MLPPPRTGFGEAEVATARSACPAVATTTFTVALLLVGFGSLVVALTFAVSEITVPDGVPAVTWSTGLKVAVAPKASDAMVQVMVPVPPTAGVTQDQPAGVGKDTKVVFAGNVSVKLTVAAAAGPLFVTTCV